MREVKLLLRWLGAQEAEIGDTIEVSDGVAEDLCNRTVPVAVLVGGSDTKLFSIQSLKKDLVKLAKARNLVFDENMTKREILALLEEDSEKRAKPTED